VLVDPADVGCAVGASRIAAGDVTYHGPGQLVGYPVLWVPGKRGGGMADTVAYVRSVEQLVIDALGDLGLRDVGRCTTFPACGSSPIPITAQDCGHRRAIESRSIDARFALNVDPTCGTFDWIVPCGIRGKAVTSHRSRRHSARRCTMSSM
jgi:lipoyl(octanoyl) transferase